MKIQGREIKTSRYPRITQGRVRKVIFDVLCGVVQDKVGIDIFAGVGSIGLEALSRGARRIAFIERDKKLCAIIRDNLKTLEFGERGDVFAMDAMRALSFLKRKGFLFETFFADPPYGYENTEEFLNHFFASGILAHNALGVIEHGRSISPGDYPDAERGYLFRKWKEKRCGDTMLTFYRGGLMG